jgi:MFS family permease
MWVQAAAIGLYAVGATFAAWSFAAVLLGAGTALVYPTLLAAVGDGAHPAWRARAVGVYRLWRDGGFAVGAVVAGVLADAFGILTAIWEGFQAGLGCWGRAPTDWRGTSG